MNLFKTIFGYLISIPARFKGVKFGKNSFIGPGYDFLFVKLKGVVTGDNVLIGKNAWIEILDKGKIIINSGSNIGRNCLISASNTIKIGKKCLLGYNVSVLDHDHLFVKNISPMDSGLGKGKKIIIEDDCFIGAHSFILKGVRLGKHCVVGANSVVTKSFPEYSVIAGNPAKKIRQIKYVN